MRPAERAPVPGTGQRGAPGDLPDPVPHPASLGPAVPAASGQNGDAAEALLLDQVEASLTITDLDGRITRWNRRAQVVFGWAAEEALGRDFRSVLRQPEGAQVDDIRASVLAGETWHGELPILRKDGSVVLSYTTLSPFRDEQGRVAGVVSVSVDITERVRKERLLAARTTVTRALAEAPTVEEAARQILAGVCENLDWDLGALWQVDESAGLLRSVDVWDQRGGGTGAFEELSRRTSFPPGVGLPGRVWERAEPAWIADVTADANFPRAPAAAAEGIHGAFGFPILLGSTVLGVLEFFSTEIREPDELLLQTTSVIGSQIGQFMERLQAQENLRQSEARTRAVLEAALDCVVTMDDRGLITDFNPAAERTFGHQRRDVLGKELAGLLIPPSLRSRHREGLARYLATGEGALLGSRVELTAMRADGSEFPAEIAVVRNDVPGPPTFTGYIRDITEAKRAREALVQSSERLRLALEAGRLGTWRWDIETGAVGWDETLEAIYGLPPGGFTGAYEEYVALLHPDDRDEVAAAVRRSVETKTGHQFEHRVIWPDGTLHWVEGRGRVILDEQGSVVGMVGVSADITSRKLESEAQRFLAEAGAMLASSLDYEETLKQVARLAVSSVGGVPLADWCAVHIRQDDGMVTTLAVEHIDPARVEMARDINRRYPEDPGSATGVGEVIRSGRSEIYPDIPDELLVQAARDEEHLAALRSVGMRSVIIAPMTIGGRTVGAITFVSAESGRVYGPQDLTFAEDLATRAALAVENARLYEAKKQVAQKLQEALLPPQLPEIPGLELAGRYHWGGEGNEVGGDFFDAFAAADGSWGLVIGDVCGKGTDAAVVTGLARHTIRAVALRETKPSRVLSSLNEAIRQQRSDRMFCTVCYVRVRPTDEGARLTLCCAGHPLPLVLRSGGSVESAGTPGTLLGIFIDPELSDRVVDLRRGDALVLFTDGVIEERAPGAVFGREGLVSVIESSRGMDADEIADSVERAVMSFRPEPPRDDIAVLVVRVKP